MGYFLAFDVTIRKNLHEKIARISVADAMDFSARLSIIKIDQCLFQLRSRKHYSTCGVSDDHTSDDQDSAEDHALTAFFLWTSVRSNGRFGSNAVLHQVTDMFELFEMFVL